MATHEFQHKLLQLQKHLYHFAYTLTSDVDNARDLLQETNLKALNNCDRFERDSNFKAWIFTIMKNTFINNYRRRINFNIINGFDGLPELNQIESVVSFDPASMLESKQLEKIVESIDDKLKVPFKMKHEGFKYKEIAEKLDIKLGTVKSRIFIARKMLMKQLNKDIIVLE
jgi:RNA polymerase sigma-70 factor (ECF subfamily)